MLIIFLYDINHLLFMKINILLIISLHTQIYKDLIENFVYKLFSTN